jgi:hypothetical protein
MKKNNKTPRAVSQVSPRARARAKMSAEALTAEDARPNDIVNRLALPTWVQNLIVPALSSRQAKRPQSITSEEMTERVRKYRETHPIV